MTARYTPEEVRQAQARCAMWDHGYKQGRGHCDFPPPGIYEELRESSLRSSYLGGYEAGYRERRGYVGMYPVPVPEGFPL